MHVFIQRQLYFSMLRIFSEGFHKPWFSDLKIPNAATATNVTHLNGLYPLQMMTRSHFKFNFQWKVTKLLPKFLVSVGKLASQRALGIGLNHPLVGAPHCRHLAFSCRNRVCTGGEYLYEFETAPVHVSWLYQSLPGWRWTRDQTFPSLGFLLSRWRSTPESWWEPRAVTERLPPPFSPARYTRLSLSCASKELGYKGCLSACLSSLFSEKQSGRGEKWWTEMSWSSGPNVILLGVLLRFQSSHSCIHQGRKWWEGNLWHVE